MVTSKASLGLHSKALPEREGADTPIPRVRSSLAIDEVPMGPLQEAEIQKVGPPNSALSIPHLWPQGHPFFQKQGD